MIKKYLLIISGLVFLWAIPVFADNYGLDAAAQEAELPKISSVPTFAGNIIGAGLSMISVVFFGLMIYAGVRWMLARGNEEEETKARDTIIGAVIGMVIVMASYALTNFAFKGAMGKTTNTKVNVSVTEQELAGVCPDSGAVECNNKEWGEGCTVGGKAGNCEKDKGKYNNPNDIIKCDCITSGPDYPASCKVKDSLTSLCQQKIIDAWKNENPNDAQKPDILSLITPEFMKKECEALDGFCMMSPTLEGMCVSVEVSICPGLNVDDCAKSSNICEWK